MRIAIVADSFPPLKNSAAVLVSSLVEALAGLGHHVLVIIPFSEGEKSCLKEDFETYQLLRIRCGKIKSHHKWMRGISELSLFFTLAREYKKSPYAFDNWDLIIWYSPSIFLGGLVRYLKNRSTNSYLILRDIVPEWMVDIGLMKKGPSYYLLKWFEQYQYRLADFIGVQSPGNQKYIEKLKLPNLKKLEVLPNWMPSTSTSYPSLGSNSSHANLEHTILCGKKVLIYAGNLGEAQGIENFAKTLLDLRDHDDCGFLIIGRGSKKEWLQEFIDSQRLKNALLLDEVDLKTLDMYYRQCYGGLVFLDAGHRTHNIPGKFVSYLEAGLPVAACVNPGNDLVDIITNENLGLVVDDPDIFSKKLIGFVSNLNDATDYSPRVRSFYEKHYRPDVIARQIINAITVQ